jgi:hypothetical protein
MAADPGASPSGEDGEDVRPPLGTWNRLYLLVIGMLAVEIALLWLLARTFR